MVEHLAMLAHFAVGATLSVSIVLCLVTSGPSKSPGRMPARPPFQQIQQMLETPSQLLVLSPGLLPVDRTKSRLECLSGFRQPGIFKV
jgi:hypothetical protein